MQWFQMDVLFFESKLLKQTACILFHPLISLLIAVMKSKVSFMSEIFVKFRDLGGRGVGGHCVEIFCFFFGRKRTAPNFDRTFYRWCGAPPAC